MNGWVLLTGTVLTSPVLWSAFVEGTVSMQTALLRLVVAIALTAFGVRVVSWLLDETSDAGVDLSSGVGPETQRLLPGGPARTDPEGPGGSSSGG